MRHRIAFSSVLVCALAACGDPASPFGQAASEPASLSRGGAPAQVAATKKHLLVTGLKELQGSAVGPGGALFVTAPLTGSIWRVDPKTGAVTLFASGLPARLPGLDYLGSGVVDVAFIGSTAYALVTGVAQDVGGHDVVGIYRVDGPHSSTIVADIGAWSIAHPPVPDFFVPTGFQYAIEPFRGGFLVTDGHHNRVLWVTRGGKITELIAFGDVVPTGLAVSGNSIYVTQAGPIPHLPQNGKVVKFELGSTTVTRWPPASGWPSTWSSAAGARCSPSRRASGTASYGGAGAAEHRRPDEGQRGRHRHDRRRRAGPADLGRDHQEHRVRRHARRRGLDGFQRRPAALRTLTGIP